MAGRTQPCRTRKTSTWNLIKLIKMGYKILDVKADIHEDVEKYFNQLLKYGCLTNDELKGMLQEDVLDIVDKHFEKIER